MPSGGTPNPPGPPDLPPPRPTSVDLKPEAMGAGEAERRKIRRRGGRSSTIFTRANELGTANVQRAGLKTDLG